MAAVLKNLLVDLRRAPTIDGVCANVPAGDRAMWSPPTPHLSSHEQAVSHMYRMQVEAAELCAPCPVKQACATQALTDRHPDEMIWAGVYFPISVGRPEAVKRLKKIAAGNVAPPPEPLQTTRMYRRQKPLNRPDNCVECERPLVPASFFGTPPEGMARYGGKGRCQGCKSRWHKKGPTA